MSSHEMKLAAAVLAGGRATRYGGADKSALDAGGGRTILARLLDELARAGLEEVVLCANDAARYAATGLPVVSDLRPAAGPLGGIEAALAHYAGRFDGTLLVPCDLPGITAGEIGALAEAFRRRGGGVVVAETGDFSWHPLCAVVHNGLLAEVSRAIDAGELGVGRLWRKLGAAAVHFDDDAPLFNVNTPEDLEAWRQRSGET